MPAHWPWWALGAGAYLAFTLASFPAGTAYRWFAPPGVELAGVEGTLWSGRAALGSAAGLALRDIGWRVRPLQLLLGRAAVDLEARLADGFVSGRIVATPGSVRFRDVRASTSLPMLRTVLPIQGTQGLASVVLTELELEGGWPLEIVGELRLSQLEVPPFVPAGRQGLIPLGNYTVQFEETADATIAARLSDAGGPLEASGTVAIDQSRSYTLDLLVKPRPEASAELIEGLAIMTAEPDAAGRRRLTLTGSL